MNRYIINILIFLIYGLPVYGIGISLECDSNYSLPDTIYLSSLGKSRKDLLEKQGVIDNRGIDSLEKEFLYLYRYSKKGSWYRVPKAPRCLQYAKLYSKSKIKKLRRVVVYSGDTIEEIATKLSKVLKRDKSKIIQSYYNCSNLVEGGIIARYYKLPYNISARSAIGYMVWKSNKEIKKIAYDNLKKFTQEDIKKYIIIASIIQKETWKKEEMSLVSAVIHNRLKKGMKLQCDATLNYGPYSHKIVTPQRIRSDTSRFNTYKYKGLPPEPLGSFTKEALIAAMKPANEPHLYFVQDIDESHIFTSNYKEHLKNIQKIKAKRAKIKK